MLPRPWNSPGKNTGVGCHFLPQCMKVKSESEVTQSCPTLATPWTAAYQAPPSMGFSRQKYWSGVPLPSPQYTHTKHRKNHCTLLFFLSWDSWNWLCDPLTDHISQFESTAPTTDLIVSLPQWKLSTVPIIDWSQYRLFNLAFKGFDTMTLICRSKHLRHFYLSEL